MNKLSVSKSLIDPTFPFASEAKSTGKLEPDFHDAFHAWHANPGPATNGVMLQKIKPIINTAVQNYAGAGAGPVVRSQAKIMALKALNSYDPERGNLKNHLLAQLQGLQRVGAQSNQIISIPERVAIDRSHLLESEGNLRDELGRDPSDMEVANRTGLSLKRIGYIRQAHSGVNTGSILDDEGEVYSPASTVPGAHSADDGWADMVYHDLGHTDQAIMEYSLGLRGVQPISNNEIAARMGLTPGAISQRKARIQQMLDERYEIDPFGGHNG